MEILLNISCLAARSVERGTGRLGFLSTVCSDPEDEDVADGGAGVVELDLVLGMELELGSK